MCMCCGMYVVGGGGGVRCSRLILKDGFDVGAGCGGSGFVWGVLVGCGESGCVMGKGGECVCVGCVVCGCILEWWLLVLE